MRASLAGSRGTPVAPGRRPILVPFLVAMLATAGCEIPTRPPVLQQRWVAPLERTSLGVEQLLPPGVSVQGEDFVITVERGSASVSLGSLCSACPFPDGGGTVYVPVPPFGGSFEAPVRLPTDLEEATVTGGSIEVSIHNGFSFDPLAGGGILSVVVEVPGEGTLSELVMQGPAVTLPPGRTTRMSFPVMPASVDSSLAVRVVLDSPGTESPTSIDLDDGVVVTLEAGSLLASRVTVRVEGRRVSFDTVELDVDGFEPAVTDRIVEGGLVLHVTNPLDIGLSGEIRVGPVAREVAISRSARSTVPLPYTGSELRSFLGSSGVTLSGDGIVSSGSATLTPDLEMVVEGRVSLTVEIR